MVLEIMDSTYYLSPIGALEIVADSRGLVSLRPAVDVSCATETETDNPHIRDTIRWLDAYFVGDFCRSIPAISAPLTPSQWDLTKIPAGTTKQYGQIKTSKHARAYGRACATNPIYIIIPCHRVVSASGVVHYGGGADMKMWLLNHETVL